MLSPSRDCRRPQAANTQSILVITSTQQAALLKYSQAHNPKICFMTCKVEDWTRSQHMVFISRMDRKYMLNNQLLVFCIMRITQYIDELV